MDNINQVGKKLRKTKDETNHNTRRLAKNFVLPERVVNTFNKVHRFKTEFSMDATSTAYLNLQIVPLTIPCTVNPPPTNVSCGATFEGDNPGTFIAPFTTTSNLVPPTPDFSYTGGGIIVPVDGCYSVLWQSPAWGVGYFANKFVTVGLTHNGYQFRTVVQGTTGVIILLGPNIYVYTPASPIYAVVECKAGDVIGAFMTQEDISQGYPWIGQGPVGGLHGFFTSYGEWSASIKVELVAVAEG